MSEARARYILALDQGTTSSRAIVFDRHGSMCGIAQRPLRQIYPRPGWVEHDPQEIWSAQIGTASEVLASMNLTAHDLAAIGIANQRETTILWNRRTGEPLHNALVWQDRRTVPFCEEVERQGHAPAIAACTGLQLNAYFAASKIRWLLDHVPGARAAADQGEIAFGTVDSWLVWKLTAGREHLTDVTNASRTMLMHLESCTWDKGMLELFQIPASVLPRIVPSSGMCAVTQGLLEGVPIAGIAGDQQAALFGQRCVEPGMLKCTYGTGGFMLMHTGERPVRSHHRLLSTVAWRMAGRTTYALEGSMLMAGAVVQWLRDELGILHAADEVEQLAESVTDSGGVVVVPSFAGLGAPFWDQGARGLILGLSRGSGRAHIARAALEGIAMQTADVLEAMAADAGRPLLELRVDGGASRNDLLMQLQADALGLDVVRARNSESTALGAAMLAGLATGIWSADETFNTAWSEERRFRPALDKGSRQHARARWTSAIALTRAWQDHQH